MKKIAVLLAFIICALIIVSGHWHWKNEINQHTTTAEALVESTDEDDLVSDEQPENSAPKATSEQVKADIDKLTASLSDDVKSKIVTAHENHKQVTVVIAGGQSIKGLAGQLEKRLNSTYGETLFKVSEFGFDDKTSVEVYNSRLYAPMAEQKPDIVIFTSLLINDVGKVSTQDSSQVPVLIGDRLKAISPETVYMIEPANPVTFNAAINERVDEVKTKAENAGYDYIDHFADWPTGSDLEADLDDKGMYPSEKGLTVWADSLANYFTSKTAE